MNRPREARRAAAEERQRAYDELSTAEKLAKHEEKIATGLYGDGARARAKLLALLEAEAKQPTRGRPR